MPAAFALGMNSGKIILIEQCRAVCGPPGIAFSQMELGRQGADAAPASYGSGGAAGEELALSASLRSAALPKGEPLAWRQGFQLNCEVSSFARASPFGRGVTAGDGEGSPPVKIQSRTVRRLSDFVLIKYAFRYSCAKQSGAHSKWSGVTRRKHRSLPAHGPRGR